MFFKLLLTFVLIAHSFQTNDWSEDRKCKNFWSALHEFVEKGIEESGNSKRLLKALYLDCYRLVDDSPQDRLNPKQWSESIEGNGYQLGGGQGFRFKKDKIKNRFSGVLTK